MKLRIKD